MCCFSFALAKPTSLLQGVGSKKVEGDPAIDHAVLLLRKKFTNILEHTFAPAEPPAFLGDRKPDQNLIIICPEDNISHEIAKQLPPESKKPSTLLLATQGTGTLHSPVNRLRFDFRRIGKAAASFLLHGTYLRSHPPSIVRSVVPFAVSIFVSQGKIKPPSDIGSEYDEIRGERI